MSARREFKKAVRVEIIKRAISGSAGVMPCCEKCGLPIFSAKFEIDHRSPDAMQIDKSAPLTAADGWLLCLPCHKDKTRKDVGDIAKAKRREARNLGLKPPGVQSIQSAPFPTFDKPSKIGREKIVKTALPPRRMYRD